MINYYKNIFVSYDSINKYIAAMAVINATGYFYINQDMKDFKNDINQDMKELKSDIKELKKIMISNKAN